MEVCRSGRLHEEEEEEEEEVLKLWEEDGEVVLAHPLGSNHHQSIGVVGESNFLTPDLDFSLFSDFGGVEWLPGFGCEEDALSFGRAKIGDSPFFLTEEEEEEDGEGEEEDKGKNITTSMSALQSRIHARLRSKRRRAKRGQKWGFYSFSDNLALLSFMPAPSLHAPLLSAPSTTTSDHTLKDSEFVRQAPSDHHYSAPEQFSSSSSLPLLSTLWPATLSAGEPQSNGQLRRCTHCLVQKTPQWRAGPRGPKTLCNACGVRFKSGRLYPEYRPAKSPTFDLYLHSNSHKKVTQMRRLKGLQTARPPMQATMHGHHLGATREVAQE